MMKRKNEDAWFWTVVDASMTATGNLFPSTLKSYLQWKYLKVRQEKYNKLLLQFTLHYHIQVRSIIIESADLLSNCHCYLISDKSAVYMRTLWHE